MKYAIDELISMIPESTLIESLRSIQSITKYPPDSFAVRCHLVHKFSLDIRILSGQILIFYDGNPMAGTTKDAFLNVLSKVIYEMDEAIEAGKVIPKKRSSFILPDSRPGPPDHMDIPVWDEETQSWYDAEC